jgi:hypothetical protein
MDPEKREMKAAKPPKRSTHGIVPATVTEQNPKHYMTFVMCCLISEQKEDRSGSTPSGRSPLASSSRAKRSFELGSIEVEDLRRC